MPGGVVQLNQEEQYVPPDIKALPLSLAEFGLPFLHSVRPSLPFSFSPCRFHPFLYHLRSSFFFSFFSYREHHTPKPRWRPSRRRCWCWSWIRRMLWTRQNRLRPIERELRTEANRWEKEKTFTETSWCLDYWCWKECRGYLQGLESEIAKVYLFNLGCISATTALSGYLRPS